jgi:hypothetical protein
MGRRFAIVILFAVTGPVLTGCRVMPLADGPPPLPQAAPPLPEVTRQLPAIDASGVSGTLIRDAASPGAGVYHRLGAEECRALACEHSSIGNLIDAAAFDPDPPRSDLMGQASIAHVRQVAAYHLSREARNRSAGAALDLYYRLQEAELLADLLAASRAEVDTLVRSAETLAAKGFKESAELVRLRKQQVELAADDARLRSGIDRLNGELKALTGLTASPGRLLPADAIVISSEPPDAQQAVAVGLASRPDLLLLRDLAAWLDHKTVEAIRRAVAGLLPPLGALNAASHVLAPGLRAILPFLARTDIEETRRQLVLVLADREQTAAKDIRSAVDEWRGRWELVRVARRRVEVAAARERELEVRRRAGAAVEADWRQARLDRLTAESELVRESAAWKRADVKVRQEIGLLCGAGGCGK